MTKDFNEKAVKTFMIDFIKEFEKKSFSSFTTSANPTQETTLTLESFRETLDQLVPILYYTTDKTIDPEEMFLIKESDFHPEFLIVHPDKLGIISKKLINRRRLVHIKEEPKEKITERLLYNLRKQSMRSDEI